MEEEELPKKYTFLLTIFEWSKGALSWIMSSSHPHERRLFIERFVAAFSGLFLLFIFLIVPVWLFSYTSMLASYDVVSKAPWTTLLPAFALLAAYSAVCASLQPVGVFHEHFIRSFFLLPFLSIALSVLVGVCLIVWGMVRLLLIPFVGI